MFSRTFGPTDEERRLGGLYEDDDGDVKKMDQEESVAVTEQDEIILPEPVGDYLLSDESFFVFDVNRIPSSYPGSPPVIFSALSGNNPLVENVAIAKACACSQPCLPIIVHGSPIVSIMTNKAALAPDTPSDEVTMVRAKEGSLKKARYCSFVYSATQLLQIKWAITDGLFQFAPTMTPLLLKEAEDRYLWNLRLASDSLDQRLDDYYLQSKEFQTPRDFLEIQEEYVLRYIHLLEYFIFETLLAPHKSDLPLSHVLTPSVLPSLKEVLLPEHRDAILGQTKEFFEYKRVHRGFDYVYDPAQECAHSDAHIGLFSWNMLRVWLHYMNDYEFIPK